MEAFLVVAVVVVVLVIAGIAFGCVVVVRTTITPPRAATTALTQTTATTITVTTEAGPTAGAMAAEMVVEEAIRGLLSTDPAISHAEGRGRHHGSFIGGSAHRVLMSTSSIRSGWPFTVASTISPTPAT